MTLATEGRVGTVTEAWTLEIPRVRDVRLPGRRALSIPDIPDRDCLRLFRSCWPGACPCQGVRSNKCFTRGLVLKAHRRLYHSTLGSRVVKKKVRSNHAERYYAVPGLPGGPCSDTGVPRS